MAPAGHHVGRGVATAHRHGRKDRQLSDRCLRGLRHRPRTGLVDHELYLPKRWTKDRERCRETKIPDERAFASRGEPAKDLVHRCMAPGLPTAWETADEAYGQDWSFHRLLEQLGAGHVVAVPKSQQIKSPYAPVGVETAEPARVAGSHWAIEKRFQAANNQCGLDEYEARRYVGRYRHITLAMLAYAFLTVLAAQTQDTAKGAAETTPPASSPSPGQRSDT